MSTKPINKEELIKFVLEGKTNSEICNLLSTTQLEVQNILKEIYSEYGVNNRVQLVVKLLNKE